MVWWGRRYGGFEWYWVVDNVVCILGGMGIDEDFGSMIGMLGMRLFGVLMEL